MRFDEKGERSFAEIFKPVTKEELKKIKAEEPPKKQDKGRKVEELRTWDR